MAGFNLVRGISGAGGMSLVSQQTWRNTPDAPYLFSFHVAIPRHTVEQKHTRRHWGRSHTPHRPASGVLIPPPASVDD